MTIKELIKELEKFPQDMIIVVGSSEDYPEEPYPTIKKHPFNTQWWNGNLEIETIPAETEYLEL